MIDDPVTDMNDLLFVFGGMSKSALSKAVKVLEIQAALSSLNAQRALLDKERTVAVAPIEDKAAQLSALEKQYRDALETLIGG